MGPNQSSTSTFADACLHHPLLRDVFYLTSYYPGEFIHTIGSPITECGIVDKGCLKTMGYTFKGRELCSGYFTKGDVFPELLYFAGNKEYSYNLVAVKNARVAWIDAKTLEFTLESDQQLSYLLMLHLAWQGLKAQVLLGCTCYRTIQKRVAFWILWMERLSPKRQIIVPVQTIWANELRVSRTSLNKELKNMEERGYFSIRGHLLEILDRQRLERLL